MQTNTKNSSPTSATPAQAQSGAPCQPCDIPPFCRSYFYTGKLLTEGDLNLEQRYASDKLRLHYVGLHGWGVVCGLMVRPHPQCPDRFVVEPGFAVDDCGREIRLVKECVTFFPKPPAPPQARGSLPPFIRPRPGATPSNLTPTFLARWRGSPAPPPPARSAVTVAVSQVCPEQPRMTSSVQCNGKAKAKEPGVALARLPRARATCPGRSAHRSCYSATALRPGCAVAFAACMAPT